MRQSDVVPHSHAGISVDLDALTVVDGVERSDSAQHWLHHHHLPVRPQLGAATIHEPPAHNLVLVYARVYSWAGR
jgi:hypothetical protein